MTYISETVNRICSKFCPMCDMCDCTYKCHDRKVIENAIHNIIQRDDFKDE